MQASGNMSLYLWGCKSRRKASFQLIGRGKGRMILILPVICSLLKLGFAVEKEEVQESQVAIQMLRNENKELRSNLIDATNRLAKFEVAKKDARKELASEDEENRRAADWRAFLLIALETLAKVDEEKQVLAKRLELLRYASQEALKTAKHVDSGKRALLEIELRESEKLLSAKGEGLSKPFIAQPDFTALSAVKIVGIRLDLGVVALAIGNKHGARIGMPFLVTRGKTVVAVLTLVEIRDRIALALINQMETGNPIHEDDLVILKKM